MPSIVVMGVAGCGKSSLGAAIARAERMPLIEGDDHHSPANRQKMAAGIALTDFDRDGWLDTLADQLQRRPLGAVLTCSALRQRYRDRLRAATPHLRFVFLEICRIEAERRVAARGDSHFFNAALVASQFETLEPPQGEPGVLTVDAMRPVDELQHEVSAWLHGRGQVEAA